jgi:major intracellular serine protease
MATAANEPLPAGVRVPSGVWLTGAPVAWDQGFRGEGVTVGIIDTGIDDTHPALAGRVAKRRDYVQDGVVPSRFHFHGTHVAGTVAACAGSLRGVAPAVALIDYRVLGADGSGSNESVRRALLDAIADGCDVVNMSLGSSVDDPALHEAVKKARAAGILIVAAAGNEGGNGQPTQYSYPGAYHEVVSVGAIEFDVTGSGAVTAPGNPWFSNRNVEVDVCADGLDVLSTMPGGRYGRLTGTSMAAPHVAGLAALLLQKARARGVMTDTGLAAPDVLTAVLRASTLDVLAPGVDTNAGAGLVTLYPQLPRRADGDPSQWRLPAMAVGQPTSTSRQDA